MITEDIKMEKKKKKPRNKWKQKRNGQNLWDAVNAVLRGKFIGKQLTKETREILSKQPKLTPKRKKNKQNLKLVEGKKS